MTLTEQLATESLPEYTEFYVRKKDGSTDTQTWLNRRHSSAVEWWNTFNITEVLAPVPSYEEWQELTAWNKEYKIREKNYGESYESLFNEKEKLKNELGLLKESIGKDCGTYYTNLFLQENKQLKVLLRECKESVLFEAKVAKETSGKDSITYKTLTRILTKIDNAIGEKK